MAADELLEIRMEAFCQPVYVQRVQNDRFSHAPAAIGAAAALQWSDINFETELLSITKTLYYKTMDEYKFVEPKTQASNRTI